jgi:hypothetical protein
MPGGLHMRRDVLLVSFFCLASAYIGIDADSTASVLGMIAERKGLTVI